MPRWTPEQLASQLERLEANGHFKTLEDEAHEAGIALPWVLAVCSRETGCHNILGDYRDGQPHGIGLMQVDIQHEFARKMRDDGTWATDTRRLVRYACGLLAALMHEAVEKAGEEDVSAMAKIASAAYNCGFVRAWEGHENGNCDEHTTGGDYGEDVVERTHAFATILDQR